MSLCRYINLCDEVSKDFMENREIHPEENDFSSQISKFMKAECELLFMKYGIGEEHSLNIIKDVVYDHLKDWYTPMFEYAEECKCINCMYPIAFVG